LLVPVLAIRTWSWVLGIGRSWTTAEQVRQLRVAVRESARGFLDRAEVTDTAAPVASMR